MRELLFLLLVLACPLAMFFMMPGGHGHGGHGRTTSGRSDEQWLSAEELRRRRGELDRLIEERERAETRVASEATPLRSTDDRERPAAASSAR
jgi:hypothetical protein